MPPLSFDDGWTDSNVDCCVNSFDEKDTTTKNVLNFSTVIPEILWLICMCGDCRYALCRLNVIR